MISKLEKVPKHSWGFKSRLRAYAFGWRSSPLACERLKEAVDEIKREARKDPVIAGDGIVTLMERIWPAFQSVDTSSGALGGAVARALEELLPIAIDAPASRNTRDRWLDRLWRAIEEDGVSYLWLVQEKWGELCRSREVASQWADRLVDDLRTAWTRPQRRGYVKGTIVCLSSLLAAGRLQELLDLLSLDQPAYWEHRKFGVRALMAEGRIEEALAYAEQSRNGYSPRRPIDAVCERILLDLGRSDEAYQRYALTANEGATGLATFRAIRKKYPRRDQTEILRDLARSSGAPGKWFAAAKQAGLLDLALEFATEGRTDPRTLTRACRDFLAEDPEFSLRAGRLAMFHILEGHGYELTVADVLESYGHFMAAARKLGVSAHQRAELVALLASHPHAEFHETLSRECSREGQAADRARRRME
jgi:hypothetical protein